MHSTHSVDVLGNHVSIINQCTTCNLGAPDAAGKAHKPCMNGFFFHSSGTPSSSSGSRGVCRTGWWCHGWCHRWCQRWWCNWRGRGRVWAITPHGVPSIGCVVAGFCLGCCWACCWACCWGCCWECCWWRFGFCSAWCCVSCIRCWHSWRGLWYCCMCSGYCGCCALTGRLAGGNCRGRVARRNCWSYTHSGCMWWSAKLVLRVWSLQRISLHLLHGICSACTRRLCLSNSRLASWRWLIPCVTQRGGRWCWLGCCTFFTIACLLIFCRGWNWTNFTPCCETTPFLSLLTSLPNMFPSGTTCMSTRARDFLMGWIVDITWLTLANLVTGGVHTSSRSLQSCSKLVFFAWNCWSTWACSCTTVTTKQGQHRAGHTPRAREYRLKGRIQKLWQQRCCSGTCVHYWLKHDFGRYRNQYFSGCQKTGL